MPDTATIASGVAASTATSLPQPTITAARWAKPDPCGDPRVATCVVDVVLPGLLTLRSVRVRRSPSGEFFAFAARCRFSDELEAEICRAARAAMRSVEDG